MRAQHPTGVAHPEPAVWGASDAFPPDATEDARARWVVDAGKLAVRAPGDQASDAHPVRKTLVEPPALCKLGADLFAER